MLKSEYAIDQVQRHLNNRGPVAITELISRAWLFDPEDGDPRWLGFAVSALDRDGLLRHVTCDPNHDHNDSCTIELVGG